MSDPACVGNLDPLILDTRPIFAGGGTPCSAIDQSVSQLQAGQRLVLLVPFEPVPLYQKLAVLGFTHEEREEADGTWRVEFRPTPGAAPLPAGSVRCECSGHLD